MLKRILREPLLHFVVVALAIFLAHGLLSRELPEKPDLIIVSSAKIEQMGSLFAATWQRPPTAEEFKGLIDDFVKEEIYYREAKKIGLDTDDTVIRRRLRLKMEFLNEAVANALAPTDAELEDYLRSRPEVFAVDPAFAFQQVFLNPLMHEGKIDQDAAAILSTLNADPKADSASFGDPTMLPTDMQLTPKHGIVQTFGSEFVEVLDKTPVDQWTGPIASGFGYHIVRISERQTGRVPSLAEARDIVLREWTEHKRKEIADQSFKTLLERYQIEIDAGNAAP
jgi:hypothetical protein